MPAEVRPYLVPEAGTVVWQPWMLLDGHEWGPLPDELQGWDPGTDLRVARRVQVDAARFFQETGVELRDVALTVSWTSSTTNMTEAAPSAQFDPAGGAVVDTILVGERVSGVLTLRTTVGLVHPPAGRAVGVAAVPGSVLAEHVQRVVLENVSSMFPVSEIDFSQTRLSPTASWHLETSTDLVASFYGTFRVLINRRDGELSAAVARGARDKRQQALLDELQAGVAGLLVELALHLRDDLADRDEWPPDSVGDVLSRILADVPLSITAPPSPVDLAEFRTQISGAVRRIGKGRVFR
ncbi:hypothetical protein [Micromonospora aurantiaca]|uniref:Uncharacterized protein n=1 Tax=Micromonospora aurantiaca (nom. illeg.) TaxID=47850 RepID=A0ABQ6UC97_9ACTN|nr:hypothetical protein [Micromonospora aurantiaca]KAB1108217.1 hypothetical protein F6X54_23345 [Micromonospora aurantiaca]UFN95653.1 hypothetical protein LF814_05700 [Micromonospora aurantiaca]